MEQNVFKSTLNGIWDTLMEGFSEGLPRLFVFLGLVAMGWVLAWLLKVWITRLVGGLERMIRSRAIKTELGQISRGMGIGRSFPELLGGFVFWAVLIFFLIAATETLGLSVLSGLMSGLARYLPNILAGAVILFTGFLLAGLARRTLTGAAARAGLGDPEFLGRTVQILVILTAVLIGIEQIGVQVEFLAKLIFLILGGLFAGLALAFGLGAKTIVGNLIASQYVLKTHRIGQVVQIGEIRGTIREVTPTAVVVETTEGRVFVPAAQFQAVSSILTSDEG